MKIKTLVAMLFPFGRGNHCGNRMRLTVTRTVVSGMKLCVLVILKDAYTPWKAVLEKLSDASFLYLY